MDLAGWSSDLDSSLLNGWNENAETNSRGSNDQNEKKENEDKSSPHRASPASSPRDDGTSWDGNLNQWPNLSAFSVEYEAAPSEKSKSSEAEIKVLQESKLSIPDVDAPAKAGPTIPAVSETTSITSGTKDASSSATESSGRSSRSKRTRSSDQSAPQLHPQAIQSSATCPPHSSGQKMLPPNFGQTFPHPSFQQPQNIFALNLSQALVPSRVATLAASLPHPNTNHSESSSTTSQNLSSLATNFMLAQNGTRALGSHLHPMVTAHQAMPSSVAGTSSSTNSQPHAVKQAISSGNSGSSSSSSSQPTRQPAQPPPFYLFDAPIELRANYVQNQRRLGIPVQHDCNSYHYGEAVKGFHPQHLSSQPVKPEGASQKVKAPVKLIDARHGLQNSGRAKNQREQKRAQKITELIDQIRENMTEGGWKVEMKSKFHTLSSCAEYVKYTVKTMKEKEEAVNKLKADLSVKEQKLEEDKAQESRSDPESVTSSLTSSTTVSARMNLKADEDKKRKADSEDSGSHKKHRVRNMSSVSTNEDSSGEDRGSRGPSAHSISIDKTVSSVSDLTDSNRGSSSNNSGSGSGSGSGCTEPVSRVSADEEEKLSSSSISSDAAVASEKSSRDRHSGSRQHDHKDVVFNNSEKRADRSRPPEEVTSLQRSFELDYEEVFDKSNIPQVIAGTSGKIVAWNKCFLKATGMRKSEVERMTIFSLVKPSKLSNFFEIVAEALRLSDEPSSSDNHLSDQEKASTTEGGIVKTNTKSDSNANNESIERKWNYAAMTLPCIDFPAMKHRREEGTFEEAAISPLNVTITLMTDKDPRKRCFHCTFTNCPGTNGALGSITPDLLTALFTAPETSKTNTGHHHHHRRKHKRARKQENPAVTEGNEDTVPQKSLKQEDDNGSKEEMDNLDFPHEHQEDEEYDKEEEEMDIMDLELLEDEE